MIQVAFPSPVKLQMQIPSLRGLRLQPFVNIDGEQFDKPRLNGYWQVQMQVVAETLQSKLALSAFITQMSAANAECLLPIVPMGRPNDATGRALSGGSIAPDYAVDHVGFAASPFEGFRLAAAVGVGASSLRITKPARSHLMAGHFISLGDRLYQVAKVSADDESETSITVGIMPQLRSGHGLGEVVIVDQLRLRCRLQDGDQIGRSVEKFKSSTMVFIEAF